jgi:predicted DCC family thiol-disulfide oxidoreductase YuxK
LNSFFVCFKFIPLYASLRLGLKNINLDFSNKQILFFDGVCNLCTSTAQFVIKKNTKGNILLASLQGRVGQQMAQQYGLSQIGSGTLVFLDNGKMYQRSTGALRITKYLKGGWPLLYIFTIVPAFIRNAVYNWVAKNRYKWFGQKAECWVPTPELKARFLD